VPEKRLPLLEAAAFDLDAQVQAMSREVRSYQREVQRVRDLVAQGHRDQASLLLTDGPAMQYMNKLRRESLALAETIQNIELFIAEERASRA
jgi:hypothetical protein